MALSDILNKLTSFGKIEQGLASNFRGQINNNFGSYSKTEEDGVVTSAEGDGIVGAILETYNHFEEKLEGTGAGTVNETINTAINSSEEKTQDLIDNKIVLAYGVDGTDDENYPIDNKGNKIEQNTGDFWYKIV